MALIKCPECQNEISDSIDTCIHCGYKLNNKKKTKIIISLIIVTLVISVFIISNISNSNVDEELESCSNESYFIGKLQADIYSKGEYRGWDDIIITGCRTWPWEERIKVACSFKHRTFSTSEYKMDSHTETYDCKK